MKTWNADGKIAVIYETVFRIHYYSPIAYIERFSN